MRQSVREETPKKSAENLIDMGKLMLEEISGAVGLPVEKIKEIASRERQKIIDDNFNRLKKYRVTGVSISNKKEIVTKLIDLLERHNHAMGR